MKRTELKRDKPLQSGRPKRKTVKRLWDDAIKKRGAEGVCRVCRRTPAGGLGDRLEVAHVSGRKYDRPLEGVRRYVLAKDGTVPAPGTLYVDPVDICPLCTSCHLAFDANEIDLLPFLTPDEQAACVLLRGGIVAAYKHLTGSREAA